jgi:hypothetical protein
LKRIAGSNLEYRLLVKLQPINEKHLRDAGEAGVYLDAVQPMTDFLSIDPNGQHARGDGGEKGRPTRCRIEHSVTYKIEAIFNR